MLANITSARNARARPLGVGLAGDTDSAPFGDGTGGSRSGTLGGGATVAAGQRLKVVWLRYAAHLLEVDEADVDWGGGQDTVKGVSSRLVTLADIARTAYTDTTPIPPVFR